MPVGAPRRLRAAGRFDDGSIQVEPSSVSGTAARGDASALPVDPQMVPAKWNDSRGALAIAHDAVRIDRHCDRPPDLRAGEPCRDPTVSSRIQAVEADASIQERTVDSDESRLSEKVQVVCGGRSAKPEFLREGRRLPRTDCQGRDDPPPRRIREQFDPMWPDALRHVEGEA